MDCNVKVVAFLGILRTIEIQILWKEYKGMLNDPDTFIIFHDFSQPVSRNVLFCRLHLRL